MDFLSVSEVDLIIQLAIALMLGMVIGTERTIAHKQAGIRTFGLVALGSCLFVVVSEMVSSSYIGSINFDPLRVAASIVTGVGFIGAGVIIFRNRHLRGLTSAAGLWVAAGIGVAVGFEFYVLAITAAILTVVTFSIMWPLEAQIRKLSEEGNYDVDR